MADNSRPYTIPYSGSRSRGEDEGFVPASQPAPGRNMNGTVETAYHGATVADNQEKPSNSGCGPAAVHSTTMHEPASQAYLGPSMYSNQPSVTSAPSQEVSSALVLSARAAADVLQRGPAHGYHAPTVEDEEEHVSGQSTNNISKESDTLSKSMDGAGDESPDCNSSVDAQRTMADGQESESDSASADEKLRMDSQVQMETIRRIEETFRHIERTVAAVHETFVSQNTAIGVLKDEVAALKERLSRNDREIKRAREMLVQSQQATQNRKLSSGVPCEGNTSKK
jgi:hypothetical protein